MSNLSNAIQAFYQLNFENLTAEQQFHFSSRLFLWSGKKQMKNEINKLRLSYSHNEQPLLALQGIVKQRKSDANYGSKNVAGLRKPYLEKYPELSAYTEVLFRVLFLKTVYNIDSIQLFGQLFDLSEVEIFAEKLESDLEAIKVLSTHAVNFLYLFHVLLKNDSSSIPLNTFFKVARTKYDLADHLNIQLLIYLVTHCVIADSMYYSQPVRNNLLNTYFEMLGYLEPIIEQHFKDINLDNKLEYIICNSLINRQSELYSRVMDECNKSVSDKGPFLIDRQNNNRQDKNMSLGKSEHRNTLYLMSQQKFNPA